MAGTDAAAWNAAPVSIAPESRRARRLGAPGPSGPFPDAARPGAAASSGRAPLDAAADDLCRHRIVTFLAKVRGTATDVEAIEIAPVGSIRIRPAAHVLQALKHLAVEVMASGEAALSRGPTATGTLLAAVPHPADGGSPGALVAVAGKRCSDASQLAMVLKKLVAHEPRGDGPTEGSSPAPESAESSPPEPRELLPHPTPPRPTPPRRGDLPLDQTAALVELVAGMQACRSRAFAAEYAADRLAEFLDCDHVAVGIIPVRGRGLRLIASAHRDAPRDVSHGSADLESAMNEATLWREPRRWSADESPGRQGLLAHATTARRLAVDCLLSVPLYAPGGTLQGVLSFAGPCRSLTPAATSRWLHAAAEPLGATFALLGRAERGPWAQRFERLGAQVTARRLTTALAALVALAIILIIPVPYHVTAPCQIEPVSRRFVTAPMDGSLECALVRPGDTVRAGQTLARLDPREVDLELSGLQAEIKRASKRRDAYLAGQDFGRAKLEGLEIQKLESRRRLFEHRRDQLRIAAPISGLIISGDLEGSQGAAIHEGDTLFEVASLEEVKVELEVDGRDVADTPAGRPVAVRLHAAAGHEIVGQLDRLGLRAEQRDNRHVFVGEMAVENAAVSLLPGMRGKAWIDAGYRSLGWVLLHDTFDRLRVATGW